jgi:hypothetical protein
MTLYQISLLFVITSTVLGVLIIVGKFLWCHISMKFSLKYKDYMNRPQLKDMMTEVIAQSGLVTYNGLVDFCKKAQIGCPKNTDLTEVSLISKNLATSMTQVLNRQEILRKDLPKEYVDKEYFKEIIGEIKQVNAVGIQDIKNLVGGIQLQVTNIAMHAVKEGRRKDDFIVLAEIVEG